MRVYKQIIGRSARFRSERSGLTRLQIDDAGVSVQQAVERTVPERRGENPPQANQKEQYLKLDGCEEIEDHHGRSEDGSRGSFPPTNVLHWPEIQGFGS